MLEILFSTPSLLIYSIFFGVSVKIADLLDEHRLKLFKGGALLFGVIWGGFGALLILSNNLLAVFFIALLIHWILRYRIDYLNHGIAASIMFIAFLYNLPNFSMDWLLFLTIFILYSLHGLLNDAADRKEFHGFGKAYFKLNSHYLWVPFLLTLINPTYWIVMGVSVLHVLSYETTKYFGMKHLPKK